MEPVEIATLVKRGDHDAFRTLFKAYYGRTYAVALRILRSRENAEDITQEAFIKAFGSLDQLKDPAKFGAWLAVIASNLARNYLKREKRIYLTDEDPAPSGEGEAAQTEDQALRALELEQVREAIKRLPPEQYQVVVLQFYYDLKVEEIAAMIGIRPGTVKSRLFRARRRLASDLKMELELEPAPGCHLDKGGDETHERQ